jgi:hypothetical protein
MPFDRSLKGLCTGVCPTCRVRWIAVRMVKRAPETGLTEAFFAVRAHGCGRRLRALDVQPVPVIPVKESA